MIFNEFVKSFYKSDILLVLPIYSAGEKSIESLKSEDLCEAVKSAGHRCSFYVDSFESCVEKLQILLKKGDILLTLGAGDVCEVGESIIEKLSC